MAVAHLGASEAHTSTTGSVSEASFSWSHAPGGTAAGVTVAVWTAAATPEVTSVTYGGVTVPAVSGGEAIDAAGEVGCVTTFHLGVAANIPAGTQTVVVNRTNSATVMSAQCVTVSAAKNTSVHTAGIVLVTGDSTVAEQSVTDGSPGANSVRYAFGHFGHQTLPTNGASSTALNSIDTGAIGFVGVRETTAGQGSRSVGMTSGTSDDRAIVHFAVREVDNIFPGVGTLALVGTLVAVAFTGPDIGRLTLTGHAPTLSVGAGTSISPAVGALSLVGQGAVLQFGVNVATGALTLVGHAPTVVSSDPNVTIPVAAGALTFTGRSVGVAFTGPITGTLAFTGLAPTLNIGGGGAGTTIAIGAGSLTLEGQFFAVQFGPDSSAGQLTLTGHAPTVSLSGQTNIPIAVGTLILTGRTPSLASTLPVGPVVLTLSGTTSLLGGTQPIPSGVLVLSGQAPSLLAGAVIAPNVGTLVLTGTTSPIGFALPISIGALSLSGQVPTLVGSGAVAPDRGVLTLTGQAPSALIAYRLDVPQGSLTITGTTTALNRTLPIGPGPLTLTGLAPAIGGGTLLAPGVRPIALTGLAPTLSVGLVLSPGAGVLTLAGTIPTLTGAGSFAPEAGGLTLAGHVPTAAVGFRLSPAIGALTLSGVAPALDLTVPLGVRAFTLTGTTPTLTGAGASAPEAGSLTLTGHAPSALIAYRITPGIGTLSLASQAPLSIVGLTTIPQAGVLTLAGPVPLVRIDLVVRPDAGTLTFTGQTLFAVVPGTVETGVGTLTITGHAPTVLSGNLGIVYHPTVHHVRRARTMTHWQRRRTTTYRT